MKMTPSEFVRAGYSFIPDVRPAQARAASRPIAAASPPPASVARTRPAPPRPTLTAAQWQERIQAIVKHPLAVGYEALALALCSDTSLSIEQAVGALKASHADDVKEVRSTGARCRLETC
jgi:hypothetical protein